MSDPIELLERRVQSVVSKKDNTFGLHFFCQIGGRYDERGIITLQVSGSGWSLLSWRQGEDTDMYSFQLRDEEMKRLYEVCLEHPFWRASPKRRTRKDHEVNYHFRVSDQAAGTCNGIQFWSDDMEEYPVLSALVVRLLRLIELLSDEEIPTDDFLP